MPLISSIRGGARALCCIAALMIGCGADDRGSGTGTGGAGSGGAGSGGAGSGGGTAGGGATPASCVNVSGDAPGDLSVSGSEFDAYAGERVHLAVVSAVGVGIGEATIEAGAFELTLPGALTDFTSIAIYVDTDSDDVCDLDEPFWEHTTGILGADVAFSASPAEWCENDNCSAWGMPVQAPCSVNGLLDLSERQVCN
jgi:hypothetical protein